MILNSRYWVGSGSQEKGEKSKTLLKQMKFVLKNTGIYTHYLHIYVQIDRQI